MNPCIKSSCNWIVIERLWLGGLSDPFHKRDFYQSECGIVNLPDAGKQVLTMKNIKFLCWLSSSLQAKGVTYQIFLFQIAFWLSPSYFPNFKWTKWFNWRAIAFSLQPCIVYYCSFFSLCLVSWPLLGRVTIIFKSQVRHLWKSPLIIQRFAKGLLCHWFQCFQNCVSGCNASSLCKHRERHQSSHVKSNKWNPCLESICLNGSQYHAEQKKAKHFYPVDVPDRRSWQTDTQIKLMADFQTLDQPQHKENDVTLSPACQRWHFPVNIATKNRTVIWNMSKNHKILIIKALWGSIAPQRIYLLLWSIPSATNL